MKGVVFHTSARMISPMAGHCSVSGASPDGSRAAR